MGPKAEELLYMLFWGCEMLSRPTWRNLTESFEGWAYRNGLLRQLQRLERQQLLEHHTDERGDRLHRLTDAGRVRALGGRDPVARWNRQWDGRWRLAVFDVPETQGKLRDKFRHYLRSRGFGCLQNSVWITPDPVTDECSLLAKGPINVKSLILLEARPAAGETDAEIVAGAWDFADLRDRYGRHEAVLNRRPRARLVTGADARTFHRWLHEERIAWENALGHDPLLPAPLLPPDYLGRKAWRKRLEVMAAAAEQMRAFHGT